MIIIIIIMIIVTIIIIIIVTIIVIIIIIMMAGCGKPLTGCGGAMKDESACMGVYVCDVYVCV